MFTTDLQSREFRRNALLLTVIAMGVVYVLWNVPALSPLAYPFRLFVTYVHEAGHSLMAVITGGEIRGFTVLSNGSGFATTAGGIRALILPAGYLGAAFFGAVLFYLINTVSFTRTLSVILGTGLVLFSVFFARPDQFGLPIALIVGVLFGLGLVWMGVKWGQTFNMFALNVLALITSLHAVFDLINLIQFTNIAMRVGGGEIRNDAAAFSREIAPLIPPQVWALLWAFMAVMMLGTAVYFSVIRPIQRGEF
ncbi:MAG: M50 family metallopeptidase [Anaerolineae bacterium]|jgi:hypothetical protein|nr:M50 family metallopeptidase [Anaerolineae bacterium]